MTWDDIGSCHGVSPDAGHPAQSITEAKFPLVLTVPVLQQTWLESSGVNTSFIISMISTPRDGHQSLSTLNTWTHFLTQVIPAADTSNSFLIGQFRSLNNEVYLLSLKWVLGYLSTSLGNFWPSPNVLLWDRSRDMMTPSITMVRLRLRGGYLITEAPDSGNALDAVTTTILHFVTGWDIGLKIYIFWLLNTLIGVNDIKFLLFQSSSL